MAEQRRIIIRAEPFGQGFDVIVQPPAEWANFNVERPTLAGAVRYAESLKIVHGWKIIHEGGDA